MTFALSQRGDKITRGNLVTPLRKSKRSSHREGLLSLRSQTLVVGWPEKPLYRLSLFPGPLILKGHLRPMRHTGSKPVFDLLPALAQRSSDLIEQHVAVAVRIQNDIAGSLQGPRDVTIGR